MSSSMSRWRTQLCRGTCSRTTTTVSGTTRTGPSSGWLWNRCLGENFQPLLILYAFLWWKLVIFFFILIKFNQVFVDVLVVFRSVSVGGNDTGPAAVRWGGPVRGWQGPAGRLQAHTAHQLPWWIVRYSPYLIVTVLASQNKIGPSSGLVEQTLAPQDKLVPTLVIVYLTCVKCEP